MRLKLIEGIVLTLLFIGMLTLAFNIQTVAAEVDWWPMFHHDPNIRDTALQQRQVQHFLYGNARSAG